MRDQKTETIHEGVVRNMINSVLKVLIIEDDRNLADALAKILIGYKEQEFSPEIAYDGDDGLSMALSREYDIILLDRMLPGLDGLDVCKKIKESDNSTPIIMVTARGEIADRVQGLESGADDYLPKPFSANELIARMKAVVRRSNNLVVNGKLKYGDLIYDPELGELICGDEHALLSEKEKALMAELMRNPGEACTKEELLDAVWKGDVSKDANNVEAYISFLRKKLTFIGTRVKIKTLRRIGYRLETE